MKTYTSHLYFMALVILGLVACDKDEPDGPPACVPVSDINQAQMSLAFKDGGGRFLYTETNPVFHKDSLKIFDLTGNRIPVLTALEQVPGGASRYWKMTIKPVYNLRTDAAAFAGEICRTYVVKYTYNTTDTLAACFRAKQTGECSTIFETFKVFQKDALLGMVTNSNSIVVSPVKE